MTSPRPSLVGRLLRALLRLAFLSALVAAAAGVAGQWWASQFLHTAALPAAVQLEVPAGATPARVVRLLQQDHQVAHDIRWRAWPRLTGVGACLQAGPHTLPAGTTPAQLAQQLCVPVQERAVRLTIPEGWDKWRIADRVSELGITDRAAFLAAVDDTALLEQLGVPSTSADGWLFPDTYQFVPGRNAVDVVTTLVRRAQQVHTDVFGETPQPPDLDGARGLTLPQLVTLASVVEREAVVAEERPVIARVFYNRLATRMPLQSDPTCIYNAERYLAVPTRADCRDANSTHSTYVVPALPPTPIGNPGRDALRAVLAPSDDAGLLYFVAMRDGTGRHAFARTLPEHNANVRRYLMRD